MGDHGQLPPVDYGRGQSVVSDPDFELKEIHRQALENPVMELAHKVRVGERVDSNTKFNEHGGYSIDHGPSCRKVYSEGLESNFADLQLLTYRNKRRVYINKKIRRELGRPPEDVAVGDKLIFLENKLSVYNGQQVIVTAVEGCRVFWDGGDTTVKYDCLNEEKPDLDFGGPVSCDFAYGLTCHKAQGSQYPKVMINLMPKDTGMLKGSGMYNKWLYTAITRAESEVHIHYSR